MDPFEARKINRGFMMSPPKKHKEDSGKIEVDLSEVSETMKTLVSKITEQNKLLNATLRRLENLKPQVVESRQVVERPILPDVLRVKEQSPQEAKETITRNDLEEIFDKIIAAMPRPVKIPDKMRIVDKDGKEVSLSGTEPPIEPPKPAPPFHIFRRIRKRASRTETFTYDGSGSITLSRTPVKGSVKVFIQGQRQHEDETWSITKKTISILTAVPSGVKIVVDYDA